MKSVTIRHAIDQEAGHEDKNCFLAFDPMEQKIGEAHVHAKMLSVLLPRQPFLVRVRAEGEQGAMDALLGAATARALYIARARSGVSSRVYCECFPDDEGLERIEILKSLGFRNDDGLVRMRRELHSGPVNQPLPDRLTVVRDSLNDEIERHYFLDRYNATFDAGRDEAWIRALRNQPDFIRILMVAPDGLAGEMLLWSEGDVGVIGVLYTTPKWQRRGVAMYLMEQARQYFVDRGIYRAQFDVWLRLRPAMRLAEACMFKPGPTLMYYPGINV